MHAEATMAKQQNLLLGAALDYAQRGWPVFPCRPQRKDPLIKNGFKNATTDLQQIAAWWHQWPDANVAIVTGRQSGLVVLDVDPRNGGDVSLDFLETEHSALPETVESLTGGGGRHLLFEHPLSGTIKSRNGTLAPGLDIKSDGGYIIVPPSTHPSGNRYEWEVTHGPDDFPLAPLPSWLLEKLTAEKNERSHSNGTGHAHFSDAKRAAILADLKDALSFISAVDYDTWLHVLMALHSIDAGSDGFNLAVEWSKTCPEKFDPDDCQNRWRSLHGDGGITYRSIFDLAKKAGWQRAKMEEAESTGEGSTTNSLEEAPRPLRRPLPDPEPFPLAALGALAAPAQLLAETIQAPVALCGQSILAAATLAVQPYRNIRIDGRVIPLSENFLTVGESGERKSAVGQEALRPHRTYEKQLHDASPAQLQDYENALAVHKKARDEILAPKNKIPPNAKKRALDELGPSPEEPLLPVFITEEPTYEGLVKLLLKGQPSLGLFADEGGRMIGGYGMSEEQQLKTAAGLCELWDGKRISRVRGGDGATLLYGRRVSMHLMAQPQVAQRLLGNSLMIDQGFLSRCLTVWPNSTAGTREYQAVNLRTAPAMMKYESRILEILQTQPPLAEGKRNELDPLPLILGEAAKTLWVKFHDCIEKQLADNQPLAPIRGLANKAPEHALRLAGGLTLYENLTAQDISAESLGAGIDLVQHYLSEALRLFHASRIDPDLELAEKLLVWAQRRDEQEVSLVDIYQRGLNAIRDAATARRLAKILEAHGWFVPIPKGKEIGGQFRREVWRVKDEFQAL